tara:strand:+ start:258 stop:572 length:315 start_codon:yes stop_codon:yes gene_type:complete
LSGQALSEQPSGQALVAGQELASTMTVFPPFFLNDLDERLNNFMFLVLAFFSLDTTFLKLFNFLTRSAFLVLFAFPLLEFSIFVLVFIDYYFTIFFYISKSFTA